MTKFRGKFLVHASKKLDIEMVNSLGINCTKLTTGAIIESAILYDVKEYKSKAEFEKDKNKHYAYAKKFGSYNYGFMVEKAHRIRNPMPYSGRLKFFEVKYPFVS